MVCKNCHNSFEGNFCNNCGQSAETHKINFHFLWHDIQHGLFHFENGILYTAKQLFTRPGKSIREFIEGKRVKHMKPISWVIILATVYGLLYSGLHINSLEEFKSLSTESERAGFEKINHWLASHFSWAILLTLPFYAIGSFIAFRKQKNNFVEHLVLNAYVAGQKLLMHIVVIPILYFSGGTVIFKVASAMLAMFDLFLMIWTYMQFFNAVSPTKRFLLCLLSYLIFIACILMISSPVNWFLNGL